MYFNMLYSVFIFLFIGTLIPTGNGLECFVCHNQDENNNKCVKTIMTCAPGEDMCLTEIKWGTTPYWQAGAKKQYYISKSCATKQRCDKMMRKYMRFCTHVWYEDWKCSECCAGDKCNYYLISSAPSWHQQSWLLGSVLLVLTKLIF